MKVDFHAGPNRSPFLRPDRRFLASLLIAVGFSLLARAPRDSVAAPGPADVEDAIQQLGAADYANREKAMEFLWKAGPIAETLLRKAMDSDEPEIAYRARKILHRFEYEISPATPSNVIVLVEQYRAGQQPQATEQLFGLGEAGIRALLVLRRSFPDADARITLAHSFASKASGLYPALLKEGNLPMAEAVLEAAAASGAAFESRNSQYDTTDDAIRNYAAWLLLNNCLNLQIVSLTRETKTNPSLRRQLAFLHRAAGNLPAAIAAASDRTMIRRLRYELGDWQALASDPGGAHEIERLGYQATYLRLAGRQAEFMQMLTQIHNYATQHPGRADSWAAAEVLLVNQRTQDAIDCLTRNNDYQSAYEILSARGCFEEAFRLVEQAGQSDVPLLPDLRRLYSCDLYALGKTNEARTLIVELLTNMAANATSFSVTNVVDTIHTLWKQSALIKAAVDSGCVSEAATYAAAWLKLIQGERPEMQQIILRGFYSDNAERADAWLSFLRAANPASTLAKHLSHLHAYFTADDEALREFLAMANANIPAIEHLTTNAQELVWQSLADAHTCLMETNLSIACERKACAASESAAAYMRLSKALARSSQWREAAAAAQRAYGIDQTPASLWVYGWALAKAGDENPGRVSRVLADRLALANDRMRIDMADTMSTLGAAEEAKRQYELVLRLGAFESWEVVQSCRQLAESAYKASDFAVTTLMLERSALHAIQQNTERNAYGHVDGIRSRVSAKALAALECGQIDDALEYARSAHNVMPLNIELPIAMIPKLDLAGRRDAADELFALTGTSLTKLLERFPGYADGHNSIAWLAAHTRRALPEGLRHARRAVELVPHAAGYRDTLAEVLFVLGRRDEAISEMRKCIEQAPWCTYYRLQLKRMLDGDIDTAPAICE